MKPQIWGQMQPSAGEYGEMGEGHRRDQPGPGLRLTCSRASPAGLRSATAHSGVGGWGAGTEMWLKWISAKLPLPQSSADEEGQRAEGGHRAARVTGKWGRESWMGQDS